MDKEELFRWLVAHHCTTNLDQYLASARKRGINPFSGVSPLQEGLEENESYRGVLIVADGDTLIGRLQEDRVVLDRKLDPIQVVPNPAAFSAYLSGQRNGDGAYVFDSVNRRIVKVREFKNDVGDPGLRIDSYLPKDFAALDASVPWDEIGTKTRLAVRLPQAYQDTHALQIKRTAYTPFGMGKVTHFDHRGLAEEFFFVQDTEVGAHLRSEHSVLGVYRAYERCGDELVRVMEQRVADPAEIGQYQLRRAA